MSKDQAEAFQKHRDAGDVAGNLAWAAQLHNKALQASSADAAVEEALGLEGEERVLLRLLRLPRRYVDIEHTNMFPVDKVRGLLRGLEAAGVLDVVDGSQAKALLPAELKRLRAEVSGSELPRGKELKARVYRPDIDGIQSPPAAAAAAASTPRRPAPAPRAAVALAELTAEDRAFREELLRAHGAMARQNHYEFMGLAPGTDDNGVRQAYMRLAREYHPDRVAGGALSGDAALQGCIDALFRRLGEAHAALLTAESRGIYDRALAALGKNTQEPQVGKRPRRPLEANNAFKMAETYLKRREMTQAEAHYRQAVGFDTEDPKLQTALAWCIFLSPEHEEGQRTAEARQRLNEIVQNHKYGDAAYKLGLLLRMADDEAGARRSFTLAHKLDPNHLEVQREIRLMKTRAKDEKGEGLLSRFLKK